MKNDAAPKGREIAGFPILTEMTGGLQGLWIIGGATGTGKSTLAMNLVAGVAAVDLPVLYLDMENDTGTDTRAVDDRLASAYGADAEARNHLRGYRRLSKLEAARTSYFPAPALIVIDHLQLLATGDDTGPRRASLDDVLRQCQDWVGSGYTVLVLSQLNRVAYNQRPRLEHFKESSAIEAAASVALGIWQQSEFAPPRVHVVKARYGQRPRFELLLARQGWRLTEDRRLPLSGARTGAAVSTESRPRLTPVQKAFIGRETARLTTRDIIQARGMMRRWDTAERHITNAVRAGEITRVRKGIYALAEIPANEPAGVRE